MNRNYIYILAEYHFESHKEMKSTLKIYSFKYNFVRDKAKY